MAEFVAGSYDSVVTRVKSYKWKVTNAVAKKCQLELDARQGKEILRSHT